MYTPNRQPRPVQLHRVKPGGLRLYFGVLLQRPVQLCGILLLLGVQMMFSFLLVDGEKPLRLCKHCQKVFLSSRSNSAFCSPRCKNQYNVYKSRGKNKGQDGENDD